jgi:hypothetical protein
LLKTSRVLPIRPAEVPQSNRILTAGLPALALVSLCFGLFLFLSGPNYAIKFTPGRLDDYSTLYSFYPPEPGADFSYTGEQVFFNLHQIPRYLPLKVSFDMSLDRPTGAAPALVEINEVNVPGYVIYKPLAKLEQVSGQNGFQTYSVILPARPDIKSGLIMQLKINPFQAAGDERVKGVQMRQVRIQAADQGVVQSEAVLFSLVILGLMLVIAAWCYLAGMAYVEISLLSLITAITCAEQVQAMHLNGGWMAVCLAGLAICCVGWWWQRKRDRPGELAWVVAGVVFMAGLFILGNTYYDDAKLYQDWIRDILKFGPFDLYHNSITFNYPPLIVYFFWVYGSIVSMLGLAGNMVALKIVVSVALLGILWLAWRFLVEHSGLSKAVLDRKLVPVFLLFGLNLHTLYNPVIWGQTELLLAFCLMGCLYLIYRQKYFIALLVLGLCLLLKLQTIMVGPLLFLLILKKYGWKRTIQGSLVTGGLMLALALPVFGFRANEITRYLFQAELGGQTMNFSRVYNFPYLLKNTFVPVSVTTGIGLMVVILVYLALSRLIFSKEVNPFIMNFSIVLAILTFFTFALKVHERYIYYTVPFMLLVVAYSYLDGDGKFSKQIRVLFLCLSLNGVLQLIFSRYTDYFALHDLTTNTFKIINSIHENIYTWYGLLVDARGGLETTLNLATIALCAWTGYLLAQAIRLKQATSREPERKAELVNSTEG